MTIRAIAFLVLACNCLLSVNAQDTAVAEKFALPPTTLGFPVRDRSAATTGFKISGEIVGQRFRQGVPLKSRARSSFSVTRSRRAGATIFRGDFDDLKVANRGISGDTTRGMLLRLEEDVLNLDPAAVVMLMGTNDLEENAEPQNDCGQCQIDH